MYKVGIRELKSRLSHHLKRVRSGVPVVVTERGRPIATISPLEPPTDLDWAHGMVASGRARWSGGKPSGCQPAVPIKKGRRASAVVLEDRR